MSCQKCHTPLTLTGLESTNLLTCDSLVPPSDRYSAFHPAKVADGFYPGSRPEWKRILQESNTPTPVYKHEVSHESGACELPQTKDATSMSFIMLGSSRATITPSGNTQDTLLSEPLSAAPLVSDLIAQSARAFEVASAHSDLDHPLCIECAEQLVTNLQKQLSDAAKERDAYISFLRSINTSIISEEEVANSYKSLETMASTEKTVLEDLNKLEDEKSAIDSEIVSLIHQYRELDLEEEQFWHARTRFAFTLDEFLHGREALNIRYDFDSRQLERLQRTNVYNDAFCIGHDGYFGTINGLRLGRLGNPPVEWAEINAAWGQTALLLFTIADRFRFEFQGYRLRPMGSLSKIEKIEYESSSSCTAPSITTLDLFSSGDLPLNLPWVHRRFDAGMVAFLECLRQLGDFVQASAIDPKSMQIANNGGPLRENQRVRQSETPCRPAGQLKLPYEIRKDKIGDASIKLGFNQNDELWTRACKYMLTCCKFLLAHASNVTDATHDQTVPAMKR